MSGSQWGVPAAECLYTLYNFEDCPYIVLITCPKVFPGVVYTNYTTNPPSLWFRFWYGFLLGIEFEVKANPTWDGRERKEAGK